MTSDDRNTDVAIKAAAEWLCSDAATRVYRPAVPCLRETYGLSAIEAVAAIRRATAIRTGRAPEC